jgi:zinc/manganese transport system substrate-binding protein
MKRFLAVLFALTVLGHAADARAAINVFACEPEWGALAKEIGGDNVSVTTATTGTQDPHHVRAKPSLLAAMRKADMVFCTGAGLEAGWLPVLMQQAAGSGVQPGQPGNLMASDFVALTDKPQRVDRAMGDIHPEGNPHIQTDPRNILAVAKALGERLTQADPANTAAYQQSLADFTARWQTATAKWTADAAKLRGVPVVVYHDQWNYLNRWLGLKEVAALEVKPGVPPTPSHLQDVLAASKAAGVKIILLTPFDNDDAAQWLAEQTGAKVVRLPFTVDGMDKTDTLQSMFEQTLSLIERALP